MNNFLLTYSALKNYGFSNTLYFLEDSSIDISEINPSQDYAILIPYDFKNTIEPKCFSAVSNYFPKIFPVIKSISFQNFSEIRNFFTDKFFTENFDVTYEEINFNEYSNAFNKIQEYLKKGDIYEVNYCIPFVFRNICIDPIALFFELADIMQAPFTALLKFENQYIISFSPERFLKKENNYLFTEPIKGTAPRSDIPEEDEKNKLSLLHSNKERTENAMIVDVSRNDLSRIAQKGSVKAEELFSIKTYRTVHQMVSKISCKLKENVTFQEIIYATFPMASMTGAPKIRAMQITDELEMEPRGYYSGCLGIYNKGNFDLSVLIRSIFYDKNKKELHVWAGSAVTIYTNAHQEYYECKLKAEKLIQILSRQLNLPQNMT